VIAVAVLHMKVRTEELARLFSSYNYTAWATLIDLAIAPRARVYLGYVEFPDNFLL